MGGLAAEGDMAEGFLGRWSQRKVQARQSAAPLEAGVADVSATSTLPLVPESQAALQPGPQAEPHTAPLTLQDVQALTAQSDFRAFAARCVAPEVRNAAMKKLFTDPHYNVMDRMDIYIDDYNLADPLPLAMARQMVGAQFLKLFDDTPADAPPLAVAAQNPESGQSEPDDPARPASQSPSAEPPTP
jgi:hypothetical protein